MDSPQSSHLVQSGSIAQPRRRWDSISALPKLNFSKNANKRSTRSSESYPTRPTPTKLSIVTRKAFTGCSRLFTCRVYELNSTFSSLGRRDPPVFLILCLSPFCSKKYWEMMEAGRRDEIDPAWLAVYAVVSTFLSFLLAWSDPNLCLPSDARSQLG